MDSLGTDVHELKLGRSFNRNEMAFHTIRYDFKPASVDTTKIANVDLPKGSDGGVTVQVPHVEGASSTHTLFKGNCKENPRECVLIIDHKTGEIILEKLSSHLQVKKTRIEGSSRTQATNVRPPTPVEKQKTVSPKRMKTSHSNSSSAPQQKSSVNSNHSKKQPKSAEIVPEMSDSSSGSSASDSDRENDECQPDIQQTTSVPRPATASKHHSKNHSGHQSSQGHKSSQPHTQQKYALLNDDLHLSESGSDSD